MVVLISFACVNKAFTPKSTVPLGLHHQTQMDQFEFLEYLYRLPVNIAPPPPPFLTARLSSLAGTTLLQYRTNVPSLVGQMPNVEFSVDA